MKLAAKIILISGGMLLSFVSLLLLHSSSAENQGQKDMLVSASDAAQTIPAGLSLRTRIVRAGRTPAKFEVHFRRGLYWKRAGLLGTVAQGQWTPWVDCSREFFQGKGASDFVVIEFPGCQDFEAEYQLAFRGEVLKTITEHGLLEFSTIVIPKWLLENGISPADTDFKDNFVSLTEFTDKRLRRFESFFGEMTPRSSRYSFETSFSGYVDSSSDVKQKNVWGRQSSPENLQLEMRLLRYLGYNGFFGEEGYEYAQKAGKGEAFSNILTVNRAQAPWHKINCPFDPPLEKRQFEMIADISKKAESYREIRNLWVKWGDEIGVIAKADHISGCSLCAKNFQDYLRSLRLEPKDFNKTAWEQVRPFADWDTGKPEGGSWQTQNPEDALNIYYSMRFMGWSTGHFYEPVSRQLKTLGVHVGPLQGPTPTWDGHSIDYFEFYRATPSTAIIWETSNSDARVWQWDGYLADITRTISREHALPVHAYIKPHRGAPTQRLLALTARGIKSFNWYCYGPPYARGDEFTSPKRTELMIEVAAASRLVAKAEDVIYDSKRVPEQSSVALLYPRTSFNLTRDFGSTNHFQDAKWVWTALKHNQVMVDVLDEELIEQGALKKYKTLYVVGSHLREATAASILKWVNQGGTVWTDIAGFSRNERDLPSPSGRSLTGQADHRADYWGADPGYRITELGSFRPKKGAKEYRPPAYATIDLLAPLQGSFPAAVARTALDASGGDILARFRDNKPAVIRRAVGKGRVFILGIFAGLSYSEKVRQTDFDMRTDFDPIIRNLITVAIPGGKDGRSAQPVMSDNPLIEATLVSNGKHAAIILSNWGFRKAEVAGKARATGQREPASLIEARDITLKVPLISSIETVESLSGQKVYASRTANGLLLKLTRLAEGDILLIRNAVLTEP